MIEVSLEFKLEAFQVNSTGDASGLSVQSSARALRLSCSKIVAARQLTEDVPSSDFDFLGSANKENKPETDEAFDAQLIAYFKGHTTVDISSVVIAYGEAGYRASAKEASGGCIGRLTLDALAQQSRMNVELILKPLEFDAIWSLTANQQLRRVLATLTCYKLKGGKPEVQNEALLAAGIFSSALQLMP